jgi:hypothetical protein
MTNQSSKTGERMSEVTVTPAPQPGNTHPKLTDAAVASIHAELEIPYDAAMLSMAWEIGPSDMAYYVRKLRGVEHPETI